MKTVKFIALLLGLSSSYLCAGEIKGTIQQIVNGVTSPAKGGATIGIIDNSGPRVDVMDAIGEASVARRIVDLDEDGKFSIKSVPEGVTLYVSIYLDSSVGKYRIVTLGAGQVLDISQTISDTTVGGVSFSGDIGWPPGITFKEKTMPFLLLTGKGNDWEYVPKRTKDSDTVFKFNHIQPGTCRLGIHSTLANGNDRYDEVEIIVTSGMSDPLTISISAS